MKRDEKNLLYGNFKEMVIEVFWDSNGFEKMLIPNSENIYSRKDVKIGFRRNLIPWKQKKICIVPTYSEKFPPILVKKIIAAGYRIAACNSKFSKYMRIRSTMILGNQIRYYYTNK